MQLNRTERMLLETAAEMFCLTWSATQAAMLTELELTDAEKVRWNGTRPQLGELLIARGELTGEMLDQVLNTVYGDVQLWSDRLASPKPQPVPKPVATPQANGSGSGELAELVTQLTALLDLLVGGQGASLENRSTRRVARPRRRVDTVIPTPPLQRTPDPETLAPLSAGRPKEADDGEDTPTIDFVLPPEAASAKPCATEDDDPDSPTVHLEREVPEQLEEERPRTLQVEREAVTDLDALFADAAETQLDAAETQLDEPADSTLHLERPVESTTDGDTIHIERLPAPTEDGPTLQVERPPNGETLQLERTAVAGDTIQLERAELSDA